MKKLFSVLMALCLLCTAVAALAEEAAPTWEDMPQVVTLDEGVELTDADFEGDWIVDKVFIDNVYLTPEEVEANGLNIRPIRIADGQIINIVTDEQGEHEAAEKYTLDSNQIQFTDGQGVEAVIEKLEDGNIVLTIFIPREDGTNSNAAFYMVHPEA
jgi:hypothetical protein